jgi:hypothetical protein
MAIVAVDPVKNIDFIPESEKDSENPFTLKVRGLTESEKLEVFDDISPDFLHEESNVRIKASFFVKLLIKTLGGWKNFNDSTGAVVTYNSRLQKQCVDRIPMDIIIEAGQRIMSLSKFTEDEVKN